MVLGHLQDGGRVCNCSSGRAKADALRWLFGRKPLDCLIYRKGVVATGSICNFRHEILDLLAFICSGQALLLSLQTNESAEVKPLLEHISECPGAMLLQLAPVKPFVGYLVRNHVWYSWLAGATFWEMSLKAWLQGSVHIIDDCLIIDGS